MRCHRNLLFVLTSIVFFFSSCKNHNDENIAASKSLRETLLVANRLIDIATSNHYRELQQKLFDPSTREKAEEKFPKAEKIARLTDTLTKYLDSIEIMLMQEAGITGTDEQTTEQWNNITMVNSFFTKQKKGEQLYARLKNYQSGVLAVDDYLAKEFRGNLLLTSVAFDKEPGNDFTKGFFYNTTVAAALTEMAKIKTNVSCIANKTITYLRNQIGSSHGWGYFNAYSAIITQNSSIVSPGENVEVIAGVGAFSLAVKPRITIDSMNVPVDESAVALKKIPAPLKPGRYTIPVEIKFIDAQSGEQREVVKKLSYTVVNKIKK